MYVGHVCTGWIFILLGHLAPVSRVCSFQGIGFCLIMGMRRVPMAVVIVMRHAKEIEGSR